MEYIRKDGTKVIVDGDKVQYGKGAMRKNKIGANYVSGLILGGYLSSFNGQFCDEIIGIEMGGLGDIVNAKIGDIKEAYEMLRAKMSTMEVTDIFNISCLVLETINEYFGGFASIEERMEYYYPQDFPESKNNTIAALKGTGAAMCTERSAVAQNLLRFLGINSFFKTSGIIKNNHREVHSYNLVELGGRYYIFDASIPSLINDQVSPLIAEIDEETFTLLSAPLSDIGISTTVSHYNPYRDSNVTITYDSGREKSIEVPPLGQKEQMHL